jgi:hypothetical protein
VRIGPRTPTRRRRPGDPSVDPTDARKVAGHVNAARGPVRKIHGADITASDESILEVIRRAWTERRLAWSPGRAGTLATLPQLADRAVIREGDRAVLVNAAPTERYPPTIRRLLGGGLQTKEARPRTVLIGMIRLPT